MPPAEGAPVYGSGHTSSVSLSARTTRCMETMNVDIRILWTMLVHYVLLDRTAGYSKRIQIGEYPECLFLHFLRL